MTTNNPVLISAITKQCNRFLELDGLRALAVLSVILFHCEITGLASAGFFGVDIFFTISGFIITAMLLKEYRNDGKLDFLSFYFRRLKRLMPPVFVLIGMAYLATDKISQDASAVMLKDLPSALFFWANWWQIADGQNYFDTTPRVLRHLWSLAVEEQFYFVWPPIAYIVLRYFSVRAVGITALSLALLSTAWMAYLYATGADASGHNRLYLGTDTHATGLLIGAALGCFWNPWAAPATARPRLGLQALAVAALAGLLYLTQTINTSHPALFQGLFLLVPVLTCIVMYATMSQPAFFLSKILRDPFSQWMGSRSYSLYLVHWPVFVWMRLHDHGDFSDWLVLMASFGIVAAMAELLYRTVEVNAKKFDLKNPGMMPKALAITAYAVMAGLMWLISVQEIDQRAATLAQSKGKTTTPAIAAAPVTPPPPIGLVDTVEAGMDASAPVSGGDEMYAIGDSVLLGASHYLSKAIPGIAIDAKVGRQASEGSLAIKTWRSHGAKASTVVVHLGTNGYINESQYRKLLEELSDRKSVILINLRAKRPWTAPNNEIIGRLAGEFSNVRVVDWHALSDNHPEFFVKDGFHLTPKGIVALTGRIKLVAGGQPLSPDAARERILAAAASAKLANSPRLASRLGASPAKPESIPVIANPAATSIAASNETSDAPGVQHERGQAASAPMDAQQID
jgi:peptidoglycan/LPS O-acetylase OafA/YrhL